jgi:tetratricopeptide (TPR) repeat protein
MRQLLFLIFLLVPCLVQLQAQSGGPLYQAHYYSQQAEEYIASKDWPEALKKLDKALDLDPGNPSYVVRKGQVLTLSGNYAGAVGAVKPLLKSKKCTPQAYQVYGNALDLLGKPDDALEVYAQGLQRFPSTGFLRMEMGIVEYARHRDSVAGAHWQKGIEEDYDFPNNYYWLARLEAEHGDYLHALLHAEIFMSLDRQVSERSKEMSRLIYEAYRKSFRLSAYNQPYFDFLGMGEAVLTLAPQNADEAVQVAYNLALEDTVRHLGIEYLPVLRSAFREEWNTRFAAQFKHPLRLWMDLLHTDGHEQAYNWWLLYDADPAAFMHWYEPNEDSYFAFEVWFIRKPLSIYLTEPSAPTRKNRKSAP